MESVLTSIVGEAGAPEDEAFSAPACAPQAERVKASVKTMFRHPLDCMMYKLRQVFLMLRK